MFAKAHSVRVSCARCAKRQSSNRYVFSRAFCTAFSQNVLRRKRGALAPHQFRVQNFNCSFSSASIKSKSILRSHISVKKALDASKPVIALESAIYSHGLPYPQNVQVWREINEIVEKHGATPATIGVVNGELVIGLTEEDLLSISIPDSQARKISRRDLPIVIAKRESGGTTVAATMIASNMAGIKVFATGGIGGVHRGGEDSMDVSADLIELGRTPVAVVCSGAKAILDIGRTLEVLETQGVPVVTIGQQSFPAFYFSNSEYQSPSMVENLEDVAKILESREELRLQTGILLANSLPQDASANGQEIKKALDQAVSDIPSEIKGKDVTPWLLDKVKSFSEGASITTNIALVKNNASVAAQLATVLSRKQNKPSNTDVNAPLLLSFGATALDITSIPRDVTPVETTTSGTVTMELGGVARNIGEAAHRLGVKRSIVVSPVLNPQKDASSSLIHSKMQNLGMSIEGLFFIDANDGKKLEFGTPVGGLLLDKDRGLVGGVADMSAVSRFITPQLVEANIRNYQPSFISFDGNVGTESIARILSEAQQQNIPTLFEPTSNQQSKKFAYAIRCLFSTSEKDKIDPLKPLLTHLTPNLFELSEMSSQIQRSSMVKNSTLFKDHYAQIQEMKIRGTSLPKFLHNNHNGNEILNNIRQLLPFVSVLWVKLGSQGLITAIKADSPLISSHRNKSISMDETDNAIIINHHPVDVLEASLLKSVVGAGDSLAGAIIAATIGKSSTPKSLDRIAEFAQRAAALTICDQRAVGPLEKLIK